jgi:hypothetical protein
MQLAAEASTSLSEQELQSLAARAEDTAERAAGVFG